MSNISAYEKNLEQRFKEISNGEKAYELHQNAILESIHFAYSIIGDQWKRVLDCGCGLGFTTETLARDLNMTAVGIDPSKASINIAKKEHKKSTFYNISAQDFPIFMEDNNIEPFHHSLVNMVLHSVDDNMVFEILKGLKNCLEPYGAIHIIVPTKEWLSDKLVEYAKSTDMRKEEGLHWVNKQLEQKTIKLPVKIRGGKFYSEPLTIYNRTLQDYGQILHSLGFAVGAQMIDDNGNCLESGIYPYWKPQDHVMNYELKHRKRELLLSLNYYQL